MTVFYRIDAPQYKGIAHPSPRRQLFAAEVERYIRDNSGKLYLNDDTYGRIEKCIGLSPHDVNDAVDDLVESERLTVTMIGKMQVLRLAERRAA